MKKVVKILAVVGMLLMIVTAVNASSAKLGVSSSSKLKAGEEVVVNVSLTNIDAGNGVSGFVGTLEYDKNVFETVSEENITGANGWSILGYNADNGKITLKRDSDFSEGGSILIIKLSVKADTSATSANITIKNAQTTDGEEDIELGSSTVTVKADAAATTEEKPATTTPTPSVSAIKDLTTATSKKIPQTGIVSYEILAIAVVAVIAIVSFVVYKKIDK